MSAPSCPSMPNTYVSHHEKDLTDLQLAEASLEQWGECLARIHGSG